MDNVVGDTFLVCRNSRCHLKIWNTSYLNVI